MPSETPTIPPDRPPRPSRVQVPGVPGVRLPPPRKPVDIVEVTKEDPPVSVAPATDQALGKLVRLLLRQFGPPLLMAALGAGGAVIARPGANPERVDATATRVTELEQRLKTEREERLVAEEQARTLRRTLRCLRDQQADAFEQLLPTNDRMGSAKRLRPWSDDCGPIPP